MRRALLATLLLAGVFPGQAAAGITAVRRAKSATVIVDLGDTRGSGSAFCISPEGYYLTNAHVADRARQGKVKLVVDPAGDNEATVMATVLRSDAESDIALLKADKPPLATLELGSDEDLIETMEATAFGYPFGKALAANKNSYPSITVNVGKITALRRKQGKLDSIQVDALVNMGCSGGPVLNAKGKVIGIVARGILGAGVNFAIPVSKIRRFLEAPELTVTAPASIAWEDRAVPQTFRVAVTAFPGSVMPDTVQIELGSSSPRTIKAEKAEAGVFTASGPVFAPEVGPKTVRVSAELANATVECPALEFGIEAGKRVVPAGEIAQYDGIDGKLTLTDGSSLEAKNTNAKGLTIMLGDARAAVPLSAIRQLTVLRPPLPREQPYTVKALQNGKLLASRQNTIAVEHDAVTGQPVAPARPAGGARIAELPELRIPQISSSEPVTKKLPSAVADVIRAGGGRYLLLHLPKMRKVAVFDVNKADITTYIPVPASEIMIAGGAEHFVIVVPGKNTVQRWSLKTMQRELTQMMPNQGVIKTIAMGAGSNGPLLVHGAVGTGALDRCNYTFLDLDTLKPVSDIEFKGRPRNGSYRDAVSIRASDDGTLFGLWCTSHSPQGLESIELQGKQAVARYDHTSVGYIVPGPRGKALFTQSGVFLPSAKPMGQTPKIMTLPSTHPVFYLGCSPPTHHEASKAQFSLYVMDSATPIIMLPPFPELSMERVAWGREALTVDKRVHFVPQSEVIITIPTSNDRLVMRRFDLQAALMSSELSFLFAESIPVTAVKAGSTYLYAVKVRSRAGGLTYRLNSAPTGMSVSPFGQLRWRVPAGQSEDAAVILTISDASGQEIFHAFDIKVVR